MSAIGPEELLQMARVGDRRVGRIVFDRYQEVVNRRVWRLLGADREHDDLVQSVFLAVFKGLSTVKEPRSLEAWILAVTHRTIYDDLKRRTRWPWSRREPEVPDLVDVSIPSYEVQELVRRVYAALAKLRPRQRMAYALHRIEERSLTEVADACSCSVATVKRDLEKAEAHLQRLAARDPLICDYLSRSGDWMERHETD